MNTTLTYLILILAITLHSLDLWASQNYFHYQQPEILHTWESHNFTEPDFHKREKFRYIYHSISAWEMWPTIDPKSFTYKLLDEPDLIQNNLKISATVIDNNHRNTFIGAITI